MNYKVEKNDGYTIVKILNKRLSGENALDLKSQLVLISSEGEQNIILNLEECESCGHYGLNVIVIGNSLCISSGGIFVITNVNDTIDETISNAQLDTDLKITYSLDQAVDMVKKSILNKINKI